MARLNPAETLVSELSVDAPWLQALRASSGLAVTIRPSWDFQPEQARKTLFEQFGTTTLDGFGVDDRALEVQAAGALVAYLRETQKSSLGHIIRLTPYRKADTLGLDEMTRRSLELTRTLREAKREGSLLHVIDRTVTPMGARLLSDYLTSPADLGRADRRAVRAPSRSWSATPAFAPTCASCWARPTTWSGWPRGSPRAGPLRATSPSLARTLALLPAVKARLTARRSTRLTQLEAALELCPEVRSAIEAALVDDPPLALKEGGLIRPGYHPELDRLRSVSKDGKSWIARYQAEQVRRTGIPGLKVGFNKVFGYYIEITHAQAQRSEIPSDYIRKQTVKNAERYYTAELKEFENEVRNADERANALEYELFTTLRDRVSADAPRLIQAGSVLAQIDVLAALAELAARHGYCRPELADEPVFEVEAGRHPVLDAMLPPGDFVPNDTRLGPDDGTIVVITGPNMAGKSTYIRQVALDRDPGPDRQLRPGQARPDRRGRPALRPRRRHRRAEPRPEHLHGRDDRDGQHPEQRHAARAW